MVKRQNKTKGGRIGETGQAQRVGIFGASGCGKTTKSRQLTGKLTRVVYFDPLNEIKASGAIPFFDIERLKVELKCSFAKGFKFAYIPSFGNEIKELNELSYFLVESLTYYLCYLYNYQQY